MGEETLLIVGNGFDLSMGFKTSYGDFLRSSVFPKYDSTLCSYLRKQFQENMGWIDIENELSEFSNVISSMKQDAKKKHDKWEYDNFRKEYDDLKSSLKKYLQEETKGQFILKKDNSAVSVIDHLPAGSKIISFNYTSIIERMTRDRFGVSKGNLLHIHGSLAPYDDIVFGVEDSAKLSKEHVFLYKAHSQSLKAREFSYWLNSAERIIFYGYSLGDTDRQYFEKFFQKLCSENSSNVDLVFYYYGQSSYDNLIWQLQMLTKHKLTQLLTYNQIEFIDCSM
ncbi:MAG: bacteriophage abortive infection AbiH family protein [Escherichia coli]|nr:bacteriophage abortive infection AbiH family protein [Escherichia coli]